MFSNNLLFQLSLEWRYWRTLWSKVAFIICGFALICTLLTFILQLGDRLFNAPPWWSNPDGHLYTVARQFDDNRLAPIHRQAIEIAAQASGVKAFSWFNVRNVRLKLAAETEQDLQVLHYSDSFFAVFGNSAITTKDSQGVWLSERYWREHLHSNANIVGQYLQHARFPAAVPILGVLPAELNRIGPFLPDIWLHDNFARYQTPFSADSGAIVDRFLRAAPVYYGVLLTEVPLNAAALAQHLQQQDLSVPGMTMGGDGSTLIVLDGINLDPPAKIRLRQQWLLAVVILAGFTLILGFNCLAMFTNRLIAQQASYRIQRTLGAQLADLLSGPLAMCALLLVVIAALAWLLFHALNGLMLQQTSYINLVGSTGLTPDLQRWLSALLLVGVLLLGCALLPLLKFSRQPLFSRQVGQSRNRGQKWLAQLNLSSQLLLALTALVFLLTFSWQQWQQFRSYALDTSLTAWQVTQKGRGMDVSALVQNNVSQVATDEVAFALEPFGSQYTIELSDDRLSGNIAVQQRVVSGNYFKLLQNPPLQGEQDWQYGIVINQTLAKLLSTDSSRPVLGSQLSLNLLDQLPIVAIVPDLPHQGFSQTSQPALYIHHSSAAFYINAASTIEFYFATKQRQHLETSLSNWLKNQLESPAFITGQTLKAIINQFDQQSRQLLLFSSLLIMLVLVAVFLSLQYQVRSRVTLEQQDYGVLLALGAPDWQLLFRASRQTMLAQALALPFSLAIIAWLLQPQSWFSSFGFGFQFLPPLFVFACCTILFIALLAAYKPVNQIIKNPIFTLLRSH